MLIIKIGCICDGEGFGDFLKIYFKMFINKLFFGFPLDEKPVRVPRVYVRTLPPIEWMRNRMFCLIINFLKKGLNFFYLFR